MPRAAPRAIWIMWRHDRCSDGSCSMLYNEPAPTRSPFNQTGCRALIMSSLSTVTKRQLERRTSLRWLGAEREHNIKTDYA